jgi:hypothetical protein
MQKFGKVTNTDYSIEASIQLFIQNIRTLGLGVRKKYSPHAPYAWSMHGRGHPTVTGQSELFRVVKNI